MKKLFSNTSFAIVLTVVLMLASVLLNTRVKLGKQCETLCERFYGDSMISASLTSLCDASEQLALLGNRYQIDEADEALEMTRSIRSMLQEHSYGAAEIYDQYNELLKSDFSLEGTLARTALSEEDDGTFVSAQHAAAEAKAVIDNSSFNELVHNFLNKNQHFPTPQLASVSGVHMPELFA